MELRHGALVEAFKSEELESLFSYGFPMVVLLFSYGYNQTCVPRIERNP